MVAVPTGSASPATALVLVVPLGPITWKEWAVCEDWHVMNLVPPMAEGFIHVSIITLKKKTNKTCLFISVGVL
jgi:hypothetical protein